MPQAGPLRGPGPALFVPCSGLRRPPGALAPSQWEHTCRKVSRHTDRTAADDFGQLEDLGVPSGRQLSRVLITCHTNPAQIAGERIVFLNRRDLLQISGLRPRPELRDLTERFGVLP
jgi:hypothetical protein